MAEAPLRIWALLGARPGDNDQVIALAETIGLPFETKQLSYNALNRLGPGALGPSLASLTRAARKTLLSEPGPDLTISTGHRSVPVVRALRRRSRTGTGAIHVGFPRVSLSHFDLVIATPQYPIADHPKLLRIPYALTRFAMHKPQADEPEIERLTRPRRLLIVGGPTLFWDLDAGRLRAALGDMLKEASTNGGSVLVTTSARTPQALITDIRAMLAAGDAPTLLASPGEAPGYASLLQAADTIHVTADSVSMISDAIWTGKPTATVPIAKSASGKFVFGLMDRLRPGALVYPQDLHEFWRVLADVGIGERLAVPQTSTDDVMSTVLDRSRAVIDTIMASRGTLKENPSA